MSAETEAALERLRMGITHFTGAVETADIRTALAEIERLTVAVKEMARMIAEERADTTASDRARAAGYEAGQRAMREAAVAVCRQTQQSYLDPQYAGHPFHSVAERFAAGQCIGAVATLPILPEPQEGQP